MMSQSRTPKLIGPFSQIVTLRNIRLRGAVNDQQLEIIENGGVIVDKGSIIETGGFDQLKSRFQGNHIEEITEKSVLLPGFVDAHTHICFAGSRAGDFAARNNGSSYQEIAAAGGGIWSTVMHTRKASKDELLHLMKQRLQTLGQNGITTVEIKSGYGLSVEHELKMLEAIKMASTACAQTIVSTCLAAHIKPRDFDGSQTEYLDLIINELVPFIKENDLTRRFDIFTEDNAFDARVSKDYLRRLAGMGFDLTVHGDQFSVGGSKVAVDVGALSVDHLEVSGENEINYIAKSNTIATALPGASLGIGCAFTPARKLLDAGCTLAIASDWNPGSAPMGDLLTQAAILASFEKLSAAEVFAAITFRAAAALNLHDRGIIEKGKKADMVAFPTDDFREILYHQGRLKPKKTWINGNSYQG